MKPYPITNESNPSPDDIKFIFDRLIEYNHVHSQTHDDQRLALFCRNDQGQIIAGLIGMTFMGYLAIDLLWVDESLRGQGIGSELLCRAEQEARARGCHSVQLDTFDFQSPQFYLKHGYEIYGILDGFAGSHQRIYFKKKLS